MKLEFFLREGGRQAIWNQLWNHLWEHRFSVPDPRVFPLPSDLFSAQTTENRNYNWACPERARPRVLLTPKLVTSELQQVTSGQLWLHLIDIKPWLLNHTAETAVTNYGNPYPYYFSFPVFCVVRHFCLSLLSNFYCGILNLYNIVWSYRKFSSICKPEEGWYGQPKYCYEKTIHVVLISFAVVFGLLVFDS